MVIKRFLQWLDRDNVNYRLYINCREMRELDEKEIKTLQSEVWKLNNALDTPVRGDK